MTHVVCYYNLATYTYLHFRGADASKNTNTDDIEMKANLVDNKGNPNQSEP